MGAKPHVCSGPECPCYQCSVCNKRWILKAKIKKHQTFEECKNKLTPAQVLIDQRQEAPAAGVQPPPVPDPGLQQEDPPLAPSEDGQHGKHNCCSLQVHYRYITTQYTVHKQVHYRYITTHNIGQSQVHCRYTTATLLHIT